MAKAPKHTPPPPSDTKTQWSVVEYERNLIADLLPLIDCAEFQNREHAVRMVMAEGVCLHIRVLAEILTSKGSTIRLDELVKPWNPKLDDPVKKLKDMFGEHGDDTKPFSNFSGRIMHADRHRGLSGEYVHHVNTLLPLVNAVIAEFPPTAGVAQIPTSKVASSISTATESGPTGLLFSQRPNGSAS